MAGLLTCSRSWTPSRRELTVDNWQWTMKNFIVGCRLSLSVKQWQKCCSIRFLQLSIGHYQLSTKKWAYSSGSVQDFHLIPFSSLRSRMPGWTIALAKIIYIFWPGSLFWCFVNFCFSKLTELYFRFLRCFISFQINSQYLCLTFWIGVFKLL